MILDPHCVILEHHWIILDHHWRIMLNWSTIMVTPLASPLGSMKHMRHTHAQNILLYAVLMGL